MITRIVRMVLGIVKCKLNKIKCKDICYFGNSVKIVNVGGAIFGKDVIIRSFCRLYTSKDDSQLFIGDNTQIGEMSTISCYNQIHIGCGVLTGPHVFISDHNHNYSDPTIHIYKQGVMCREGDKVIIDDGCWIGTNVVIVGNIHIGKNCVIGANSVVTKDIPDFCVAAGSPCKILKKYNILEKTWDRV